jgi:hypothetical protein
MDLIPHSDVYCIGNVYFDANHRYKKNAAYLKHIDTNERREAQIYQTLISTRGIKTILLDEPVHEEPFFNYFFRYDLKAVSHIIDTAAVPSICQKYRRLSRLHDENTQLRFVCIGAADETNRHYFMNTIMHAMFSQHAELKEYFLFPESYDSDTFIEVWKTYSDITDSLSKIDFNSSYIALLEKAIDIRFFKSCKKRKVRDFVEHLRHFYFNEHPEMATPFIVRLCNSYISKKEKHQKALKEQFATSQIVSALAVHQSRPAIFQGSYCDIKKDVEFNLRHFLNTTALECSYLKLYQPLFHFYHTDVENDLLHHHGKNEIARVGDRDFLIFYERK